MCVCVCVCVRVCLCSFVNSYRKLSRSSAASTTLPQLFGERREPLIVQVAETRWRDKIRRAGGNATGRWHGKTWCMHVRPESTQPSPRPGRHELGIDSGVAAPPPILGYAAKAGVLFMPAARRVASERPVWRQVPFATKDTRLCRWHATGSTHARARVCITCRHPCVPRVCAGA